MNCLILMDVGEPKYIDDWSSNQDVYVAFLKFLDAKLTSLKKQNFKIVESNYLGKTNPLLKTTFDLSTTKQEELLNYFESNQFEKIIYAGFHYPICTHTERKTSYKCIYKENSNLPLFICPFLTRPLESLYGEICPDDNANGFLQIML